MGSVISGRRALMEERRQEKLFTAVKEGDAAALRDLVTQGADVNKWGASGLSPLTAAAEAGQELCLQILLDSGADVNGSDASGSSALVVAAKVEQEQCLKKLLDSGADVNGVDRDGNTALVMAVRNGKWKCVELLQNSGADVNLVEAASLGDAKCVELLLKSGANVNAIDTQGRSALWNAMVDGHAQCVELLLKSGAHANPMDNAGTNAFLKAVENGHSDCVRLLLKFPSNSSGAECSDTLLKEGAALGAAAQHSHPALVSMLIQAEANPNAVDSHTAQNALGVAANEGQDDCVRVLLWAGARVNTRDRLLVVRKKRYEHGTVVEMLIAAGVPEVQVQMQQTPLFRNHRTEMLSRTYRVPRMGSLGSLKERCRISLRKHLLTVDSVNLFCRIPKLGLPPTLQKYLLFDVELDEPKN